MNTDSQTSTTLWRDPVLLLPLAAILVAGVVLAVSWRDLAGSPNEAGIPTATAEPSDPAALALLQKMEAAMNQLKTLKVIEILKDDSGNMLTTTLEYAAPNKVALMTDTGSFSIGIANQQWARSPGETLWSTWTRRESFEFPDFHYYSRQAVDVQLGLDSQLQGRPVKTVTFAFTGFEGRFDFVIYADLNTLRFQRLTMDGPGHHMVTDFVDYAPTVTITPPAPDQIAPTPTVLIPQS